MTKKILVFDVETTTFQKGSPFSGKNSLQYVGLTDGITCDILSVEYDNEPYQDKLDYIKKRIEACDVLVGFNIKFDLHWILRYIPDLKIPKEIFDCQLAEFLLRHQLNPYPSLNEACERYGLGSKLSVVEQDYWSQGIDTPDVPKEILEEYLTEDLKLTYALQALQCTDLAKDNLWDLFTLQSEDELVLLEIEQEGLPYFDTEEAQTVSTTVQQLLDDNENSLNSVFGVNDINWDSPQQVSTILFGGTIKYRERVPVTKTLKSGETKEYERWEQVDRTYPRILELPKGDRNGRGAYSVDEDALKTFKWGPYKKVKKLLLRRRELAKLQSTYLKGFIELIKEKDWPANRIFPTYNQTTVVTGRLASTAPNGQNIPAIIRKLFKANIPAAENNGDK